MKGEDLIAERTRRCEPDCLLPSTTLNLLADWLQNEPYASNLETPKVGASSRQLAGCRRQMGDDAESFRH